uniref:RxLR effector candidate protein n=1 Tax=Hyaloperonospora arabidopsidis (strain Emoy2) TaxID=559515 RepID=M4BYG3_HYAAE|nr:RxLR effector candidate protein [Hyaloperonospora arabidopsidis Emoy2]
MESPICSRSTGQDLWVAGSPASCFIHQFALDSNPPYPNEPFNPVMKVFYIRALYAGSVLSAISDHAYGGIEPDVAATAARRMDREVIERQLRTSADVKIDQEERMNFRAPSSIESGISTVHSPQSSLASVDSEALQAQIGQVIDSLGHVEKAKAVLMKLRKDDATSEQLGDAIETLKILIKRGQVPPKVGKTQAQIDENQDSLHRAKMILEHTMMRKKIKDE